MGKLMALLSTLALHLLPKPEKSLKKDSLREAHLERFNLKGFDLIEANLEGAFLMGANLAGAVLNRAHLVGADLREACMEKSALIGASLEGADLHGANLEGASLSEANLQGADLQGANLKKTDLSRAKLEGADLHGANLEGADLHEAVLGGSLVPDDTLSYIRQWNKDFPAILSPTDLRGVFFNSATNLKDVTLGNAENGFVLLADVHWGNANLTVVNWARVTILGDEHEVSQWKYRGYSRKKQLEMYREAIRANRQLAAVLQEQGIQEKADYFAYRAQVLHRQILWLQLLQPLIRLWERIQKISIRKLFVKIGRGIRETGAWLRKLGSFIFFLLLGVLAGYGYKPGRSVLWYLLVIFGFAAVYHVFYNLPNLEAFFLSLTSFHGRGFFPGPANKSLLKSPIELLAAIEAVIGLFIEISFVAAFTRRFFGK